MFRHYLKASLNTFKRFSIQLSLAMFSLIIGLTGAAVLLLYAYQEFSHDDKIPNAENIYRLEIAYERGGTVSNFTNMPRPLPLIFSSVMDEIDVLTRFWIDHGQDMQLTIRNTDFTRLGISTDKNFFKVFDFPVVLGDLDKFYEHPDAIVITESTSKALFGDVDPVGETLLVDEIIHTGTDTKRLMTITTVIKDLPEDIHLDGDYFYRLDESIYNALDSETDEESWDGAIYQTYFTLKKDINPSQVSSKFPQFVEQYLPELFRIQLKMSLSMVSVKDIYFHGTKSRALKPRGNITLVYGFMIIAGILIIISSFNFTNLMLAVHSARRKELALRKVAGASQVQLISHITAEITFLILIGILASILFATLLLPLFNQLFLVALSQNLFENPAIALGYGAILIAVVIFSSVSPSRMVGSIRPALVLSGSELQQKSSKLLRNSFLTIQFTIAVALIPIVLVVLTQVNYAEQKDMGFKKENIVAIRGILNREISPKRDALINEIEALPYVQSTALSNKIPGDNGSWANLKLSRADRPKETSTISIYHQNTGYDYFKTYKIDILAGRTFDKDIYQDNAFYKSKDKPEKTTNILINESALKALGYKSPEEALGQVVITELFRGMELTIIGVVPDINLVSLKNGIKPEIHINFNNWQQVLSIAFEANDTEKVINDLKAIWKKLGISLPMEYVFVQDNWNRAYAEDRMAANIFTAFALIGVLISLAGIYSVMLFETSKQLHEVAIRKVMGGSIKDIMKLLMLKSSIPVVIASVIALPLAWYGLSQWLNGYVDRITLDPLVFIGSGLAMLAISWITVGSHAYKVASAKPAEALRRQ